MPVCWASPITSVKKGHLSTPCHYQFCLGGGMPATVENPIYLKGPHPRRLHVVPFGIGAAHLPILQYAALALGGHIRVGMRITSFLSARDENGKKMGYQPDAGAAGCGRPQTPSAISLPPRRGP